MLNIRYVYSYIYRVTAAAGAAPTKKDRVASCTILHGREKTAKWPFSESKNAVTVADAFAFVFFIYSPRHDERIAF